MLESILTILLIIATTVLAAVVFVGWVIVSLARLLWRSVCRLTGFGAAPPPRVRGCPHPRCGCGNPMNAKFCRRCGTALPDVQHVVVTRKAAVW